VRTSLVLPLYFPRTSFDKGVQGSMSEAQEEYDESTRGIQTLYSLSAYLVLPRTPTYLKKC
jgi:hypothetical protein